MKIQVFVKERGGDKKKKKIKDIIKASWSIHIVLVRTDKTINVS